MEQQTVLILAAIFFCTVAAAVGLFRWVKGSHFIEKRTVKKRLLYISAGGRHGHDKLSLYRNRVLNDVGVVERFFLTLPRLSSLDNLLLKTKAPLNASGFISLSLLLGCLAGGIGWYYLPQRSLAIALGLLLLASPYLLLKSAERKYYERFHEQLPEALDLIARALRSGHALTSGLEMVATEMDDPIRSEFSVVNDEVGLGLTMKEAFDNLCERVESMELRFFAIAVLVQKETGGNLTEVLDQISSLIRERTVFDRQVRTLTAEGRLSGIILIALPIFMFVYIYFANYDYLSLLWTTPIGKNMMMGAIALQVIGAYLIKRIVTIEL
ncbi:MAG: type II secretion system F family protein [Desulfuromonas sp.]|nr:type II secretion system F family protein [Desulfuromonas sp.]